MAVFGVIDEPVQCVHDSILGSPWVWAWSQRPGRRGRERF